MGWNFWGVPSRQGLDIENKEKESHQVRTRLVILPLNTVQSVPPMKHYRTGSLSLDAHGESSDKNARATDNAADDLFMSSQASLSYFLYIFMSSCNFLVSFWCRKSVLKQQIHCKSMFNCQKISRLRRANFFFANLTFILVLDIKKKSTTLF